MNPEGGKILQLSVQRLATEIAPLLTTQFGQGQIGLLGFVLTLVANEYERGADLRAKENAAIRKLFAELAPQIADAALATKLRAAAAGSDTSLRISALNEANYALRRLLIELHAHVETLADPNARAMEREIWALLRDIAAERAVKLG